MRVVLRHLCGTVDSGKGCQNHVNMPFVEHAPADKFYRLFADQSTCHVLWGILEI